MTCGEWVVAMNWQLRKCRSQVADDLALPLRMEVQIDLVDQHDRFRLGGGVFDLRIGLGETPRQVEHERQRAALAVRQLSHRERRAPIDRSVASAVIAIDAQVRVARQEPRDGILEGRKHATSRRRLSDFSAS